MQFITINETDLMVSRIGLGGWSWGGSGWGRVDEGEVRRAIAASVDEGVNLFDTADVYGFGRSERVLSEGLGNSLQKAIIATKFGVKWDSSGKTGRDCSPAYVVSALHDSLRRLRREQIDLYQIHWPDPSTPIEKTMGALNRCREQGKIRYIGCSNFSRRQLLEARQFGSVVSIQAPYSIVDRRAQVDFLAEDPLPVALLAYSPLAQGLLTGKYDVTARFGSADVRSRTGYFSGEVLRSHLRRVAQLREVAKRNGRKVSQVAIRWVLDTPGVSVALVGVKNPEQLTENLAVDWMMEAADHALLTAGPESPASARSEDEATV